MHFIDCQGARIADQPSRVDWVAMGARLAFACVICGAVDAMSSPVAAQNAAPPAHQTSTQTAPPRQTAPQSEPPAAKSDVSRGATPAMVLDDKDVEGILGKEIYSTTGEDMGRIIDVLVDRNGDVRAAVIDFGGFLGVGSRKIAVEWHALQFAPGGKLDHIVLSLSRNEVRVAPEIKPGEPIVVLGPSPTQPPAPVAKPTPAPGARPTAVPASKPEAATDHKPAGASAK